MRVADFRALAEERIGLVEKEDGAGILGSGEYSIEILLRLTDVLAHHAGEVDLVQLEAQLTGEDLGGQRLARAGWAREQCGHALAERELASKAPVVHYASAPGHHLYDLSKLRQGVVGKHEVGPAVAGLDLARETGEILTALRSRAREEITRGHGPARA